MRIRTSLLCILLSTLAAPACFADWLVLQGGKQVETKGRWAIAGNLLSFREVGGTPKRVLLSVIDFDATLKANPRTTKATKARDPEWHISAQGIKMLQETAREQQAMEARMRAQQEMSAQMGSVAPKPGVIAGSPASPQGQGKSQANGQYGGYATKGLQGIAVCKVYQDNPSLYSSCLAQY